MKIKKALAVILLVGGLLASWSLQAAAAGGWFICRVNQAGPYGVSETSGSRIFLTDTASNPAFPAKKEFSVYAVRAREFLDVALTAMANGKKVKILSTLSGTVPAITAIYLLEQ